MGIVNTVDALEQNEISVQTHMQSKHVVKHGQRQYRDAYGTTIAVQTHMQCEACS